MSRQITQNITLALPKDLLQELKILATKKNLSVSKLLHKTAETLVREESNYQDAMEKNIARLEQGYFLDSEPVIPTSKPSKNPMDEAHDKIYIA